MGPFPPVKRIEISAEHIQVTGVKRRPKDFRAR